ncbi:PAS domain-containing protein [Streptomyces sp. NPDC001530]|uniref:PAS domain-containing protein n=1 Tax=Streptomyces sp. NPDC001530 TaxID=3364582 RepID=UPI0036982727
MTSIAEGGCVFDVVRQPVRAVDADHTVRYANPAAAEAMGYDRPADLLGREGRPAMAAGQPVPEHVGDTGTLRGEGTLTCADRSLLPVEWTASTPGPCSGSRNAWCAPCPASTWHGRNWARLLHRPSDCSAARHATPRRPWPASGRSPTPEPQPWLVETHVYVVVAEAVDRAVEHARAANVQVTADLATSLTVTVVDDGSPPTAADRAALTALLRHVTRATDDM